MPVIETTAEIINRRPNLAHEREEGKKLYATHAWSADAQEAIDLYDPCRNSDILRTGEDTVLTNFGAEIDCYEQYILLTIAELDDRIAEFVRMPRRMREWAESEGYHEEDNNATTNPN